MEQFTFRATAEMVLIINPEKITNIRENGSERDSYFVKSELKAVNIHLDPDKKATASAYLTTGNLLTKEGIRLMTQCFIQGLLAVAKYGASKELASFKGHIAHVRHELLRLSEADESQNS